MRIKIFKANISHDVKRGAGIGGGGGSCPAISVTMTLIFPKIVWTCPLTLCDNHHSKNTKQNNRVNVAITVYITTTELQQSFSYTLFLVQICQKIFRVLLFIISYGVIIYRKY